MNKADMCFDFKDNRYGYHLQVYEPLISDTKVKLNENENGGSFSIPLRDYENVITKLKAYIAEQITDLGESSFENQNDLLSISVGHLNHYSEYRNNSGFWDNVINILKPLMHNTPSVQ